MLRRVRGHDQVELFDALRRHCDAHAVVCGRERTLVPNVYLVRLAPGVSVSLDVHTVALSQELTDVLALHGAECAYEWAGPLTVRVTSTGTPVDAGYHIVSEASPNSPTAPFTELATTA
ncbi:FhaA domain-containing protein [Streptomyces kronopolitis]|uniref:FhaA domain-containing protein n=1 Tax=Streptomyces kronopolitis TaxID=1612435 RepID=UPI001E4F68D3|nr:FhaA domain-containing protein [Streptomyces kronopolitis]